MLSLTFATTFPPLVLRVKTKVFQSDCGVGILIDSNNSHSFSSSANSSGWNKIIYVL